MILNNFKGMDVNTNSIRSFFVMMALGMVVANTATAVDVPLGYDAIANQDEAEKLCPGACATVGRVWNGQWTNKNNGPNPTVCGCNHGTHRLA